METSHFKSKHSALQQNNTKSVLSDISKIPQNERFYSNFVLLYSNTSLQMLIFPQTPIMWPFYTDATKALHHLQYISSMHIPALKNNTCLLPQTQKKVKRGTIHGEVGLFSYTHLKGSQASGLSQSQKNEISELNVWEQRVVTCSCVVDEGSSKD